MGKEPKGDDPRQLTKLSIPSSKMLVNAPIAVSKRMSGALRCFSVAMKKSLKAWREFFSPMLTGLAVSVGTALLATSCRRETAPVA